MIHRLATTLVLAAAAAAQSPTHKADAHDAPTPAMLTAAWQMPLVDTAPDGTVWVAGPTYKAQFRPEGVQFLPFFGSDLPANVTLDLTLDAVWLGGEDLPVHDALAQHRGSTIDYERGACRETFRYGTEGIEQLFTFDRLPQRGELELSVRVQTPLRGQQTTAGLEFVHERGAVRYSAAIAIDARGRRLPLPTTLDGDHIRFAVPAAFVTEAALPLVIDPLIGTTYSGPTQTYRFTGKDLAFDATANEWQVVTSYLFSATDSDVKAQRFSGTWTQLANPFSIDITTDSWLAPSIANLNLYDRFLVVAQETAGGTNRIAGRITSAGNDVPATAQFDVEGPGAAGNLGLQASNPDVGGDPALSSPTYWTVVYQVNNAGNADIRARQVTDTGTLRGTSPIAVATTTDQETRPRISKSNGKAPFTSQTWCIAWNNDVWQIFGRPMTWNGTLAGPSQILFTGVTANDQFDVSSPTEDEGGQRRFLLTFEYQLPQVGFDIVGVVLDRLLTPLANPISLTERCLVAAANARNQKQPSVDSDGVRFVVGFVDEFTAWDFDVHAAVFNLAANEFGLLKSVQKDSIATSNDMEVQPRVCAVASGAGGRLQYGLAWSHEAPGGDYLQATAYEGRQDGALVTGRAVGCGGLGITHTGLPLSGETLTVQVLNSNYLTGLVVGFPTTQAIPGCPSCWQGVDSLATLLSTQFQLAIPRDGSFVGLTLAFQGFDLGVGPCLAQVRLSDALDATIR